MRLTFQLSAAAAPELPPASVAVTEKVCLPFLTVTVNGEVQALNSCFPSRMQLNVAPGSSEVNVNVAFARFFLVLTFSFGPPVIVAVGAGGQGLRSLSWDSSPKPSRSQSGSIVA